MWHWSLLEMELGRSVRVLLRLKGVEGAVATANIPLRDKIHLSRTLVNVFGLGDADALAAANKTFDQIADMSAQRNVVAHNAFIPGPEGEVEFIITKAKGKFSVPKTVWAAAQFHERFAKMDALMHELRGITTNADLFRQPLATTNALGLFGTRAPPGSFAATLESASEGPLGILARQLPEPQSSPSANPKKPRETPKAPRPKPKG